MPSFPAGGAARSDNSRLARLRANASQFCRPGFSDWFSDYNLGGDKLVNRSASSNSATQCLLSKTQGGGVIKLTSITLAACASLEPVDVFGAASGSGRGTVNNPLTDAWMIAGRVRFTHHPATGTACIALVSAQDTGGSTTGVITTNYGQALFTALGMFGPNSTAFLSMATFDGAAPHYQTTSIPWDAALTEEISLGSDGAGRISALVNGVTEWSTNDTAGIQALPSWATPFVNCTNTAALEMLIDYAYAAGDPPSALS